MGFGFNLGCEPFGLLVLVLTHFPGRWKFSALILHCSTAKIHLYMDMYTTPCWAQVMKHLIQKINANPGSVTMTTELPW